ncbi:galactoside alpha-(1,2)-fucosyltransferase 2-like isoform X2 [Eriocheir sinensis]|uniref:galactoside alpha-(1,2)-fucosyltransferase 2-like isoform X2 n=1 Tax=Eriocheir sinensis TaxID=95602 RepID=UPI0021C73796|nr:galactoside alpha-(1,2)-fucosyltransferase 2-like isoform X2 [Eriocheir sinensis]
MSWCSGVSLWGWSGRRQLLVMVLLSAVMCLLHLLAQHRAIQLYPSPKLQMRVGEARHGRESLVSPRSPTSPPTLTSTGARGREAKNEAHQNASLENDHLEAIPLENRIILSSWPPKVRFPLMVFLNVGRLGNRLNMYAVALAFQEVHRASSTVAITRDSMVELVALLDPAHLPLHVVDRFLIGEAMEEEAIERVIPDYLKNDMVSHLEPTFQRAEKEYRESGKPKMYTMEGYQNRMWLIAGHHHTIRAAFRIRDDLKQKAARFLEGVRQRRGRRDITFVGFHIRRTDYIDHFRTFFNCTSPLPGPAFYQLAMNHYRATLRNPVFVVASDDLSNARQHLNTSTDVEFTDMKTAAEDMALLGSCSHSIMTVGSFGFWASFFAGGQVVYPLITNCTLKPFVHPDHLGPRGYENWKAIDVGGGGPV